MSDARPVQSVLGLIDEWDEQSEFAGAPERALLNYAEECEWADRETFKSVLDDLEDAGTVERFKDVSTLTDSADPVQKYKRTEAQA